MKTKILLLLLLSGCMSPVNKHDDYKITNYVNDYGYYYSTNQMSYLNNYIYECNKKRNVEICILTIPTLNDQDQFDYSLRKFNESGIGNKQSGNGLLIFFSKNDHKISIRVGSGLESRLTDYDCSNIKNNILIPMFSKSLYFDGTLTALSNIDSILSK